MLKLAAWLKVMGFFKKVNFIFLIVGHTKTAADSLFNSLKHEYRKENLFTMEALFNCLSVSECVTVMPTLHTLDAGKTFEFHSIKQYQIECHSIKQYISNSIRI